MSAASILIIDDEKAVAGFFADLFKLFDTPVDLVHNGADGLKKARRGNYKLIFLDHKLGDMTGVEVLQELKAEKPDANVVMISAYLTDEVSNKLRKLGVRGILNKPLEAEKILTFARKYVSERTFN